MTRKQIIRKLWNEHLNSEICNVIAAAAVAAAVRGGSTCLYFNCARAASKFYKLITIIYAVKLQQLVINSVKFVHATPGLAKQQTITSCIQLLIRQFSTAAPRPWGRTISFACNSKQSSTSFHSCLSKKWKSRVINFFVDAAALTRKCGSSWQVQRFPCHAPKTCRASGKHWERIVLKFRYEPHNAAKIRQLWLTCHEMQSNQPATS